ncbi:transglutaminase-like cysteine peptidase [Uliginosibacterium aquaticum]|uniref:Transglutaminase-like cysteine peptidase n=1 Tax=Uliginosibacterium aquaticum TaxID=2731212 RepID=A0ABX2IJP6_9RHOO|nr:transglutaminase-like cysteine peptidase [Uliginosibacterium aquaticum]NSL54280.1 transglutaminase-like cysteine peptidase [Uliginosibacterium aquaticum]
MSYKELFHTCSARWRRAVLLGGLCALLSLGVFAWAGVDLDRMLVSMRERYGSAGEQSLREWRDMLQGAGNLSEADKLRRVNDFFNRRIRFLDDVVVWRVADYWATPIEFLGQGAGDCEDYAIAKLHSLLELGVAPERLRMIYVRATLGSPGSPVQVAHMVLGYYAAPDAEPLVLDNLITDIRPASRRPDLAPVFSFNREGVFMGGATRPTSPVDRLSLWAGLKSKMRAEGYEP